MTADLPTSSTLEPSDITRLIRSVNNLGLVWIAAITVPAAASIIASGGTFRRTESPILLDGLLVLASLMALVWAARRTKNQGSIDLVPRLRLLASLAPPAFVVLALLLVTLDRVEAETNGLTEAIEIAGVLLFAASLFAPVGLLVVANKALGTRVSIAGVVRFSVLAVAVLALSGLLYALGQPVFEPSVEALGGTVEGEKGVRVQQKGE